MTTTIIMYAIQHKPTGKYLPAPQGRGGRGGSFMEPVSFNDPQRTKTLSNKTQGLIPRLWATERAAKIALSYWCKGKFVCSRGGDMEDYWEDVAIKPVNSRVHEDMEIVEVKVELP